MSEPLLIIDDNFLTELTALSPEYNRIKLLFESIVQDRVQRQYVIFLALLNKRINTILGNLKQLEDSENSFIKKRLRSVTDQEVFSERVSELNKEFTKAFDELKSIGKDLLNSEYYKESLKSYLENSDSKYLAAKIYNKYNLPLPTRMTAFSDGYDICLPSDIILFKDTPLIVDTGFIIEPPDGYHIEIQIRSSLAKIGVIMPTGVSIIDSDYCGKDDFIKLLLIYVGNEKSIHLNSQDRVAQLRFIKNTPDVQFVQISDSEIKSKTRGGLGSTN